MSSLVLIFLEPSAALNKCNGEIFLFTGQTPATLNSLEIHQSLLIALQIQQIKVLLDSHIWVAIFHSLNVTSNFLIQSTNCWMFVCRFWNIKNLYVGRFPSRGFLYLLNISIRDTNYPGTLTQQRAVERSYLYPFSQCDCANLFLAFQVDLFFVILWNYWEYAFRKHFVY